MPRGASPKREKEYQELVGEFKEEHRYEGREEGVAARIVNKQRAQHSETLAQKQDDRQGRSPDRKLPMPDFDELTVDEIAEKLDDLDDHEVELIREYEARHRDRKTLHEVIDRRLHR